MCWGRRRLTIPGLAFPVLVTSTATVCPICFSARREWTARWHRMQVRPMSFSAVRFCRLTRAFAVHCARRPAMKRTCQIHRSASPGMAAMTIAPMHVFGWRFVTTQSSQARCSPTPMSCWSARRRRCRARFPMGSTRHRCRGRSVGVSPRRISRPLQLQSLRCATQMRRSQAWRRVHCNCMANRLAPSGHLSNYQRNLLPILCGISLQP